MGEALGPFVRNGTKEEPIQVSADEVLNAIAEGRDIYVEYAVISDELNIKRIASEATDRLINGSVKIQHSTFSAGVDCRKTVFINRLDFRGTVFKEGAEFWGARFDEFVNFGEVMFSRFADFGRATFSNIANFGGTLFNGRADFEGAVFGEDVGFTGAIFREYGKFAGATFAKFGTFVGSTFNGRANFNGTTFTKDAGFTGVSFSEVPNLDRATLSGFSAATLNAVGWACRRSLLYGAGHFFEQAGECYLEEELPDHSNATYSFRNAKVEYEKEGKYADAGRMYVKEKESSRQL